jgi:hypothetical protein
LIFALKSQPFDNIFSANPRKKFSLGWKLMEL